MKTVSLKATPAILGWIAWALFTPQAWAVLGQAPTTYPSNTASTHSSSPLVATELFTMTAVTWRGPVLPDLAPLLGTYFAAFKLASHETQQSGGRGSPVSVDQDGLVVKSSGRRPNLFGYAYLPRLTPPNLQIKDVVQ
jgi:hypothetical protein